MSHVVLVRIRIRIYGVDFYSTFHIHNFSFIIFSFFFFSRLFRSTSSNSSQGSPIQVVDKQQHSNRIEKLNDSTNDYIKSLERSQNMVDTPTKQSEGNNPRKDHYSYSYTYKTADSETGVPGVSSVEVNESVTEEIGPDGSKIIRRHQQEKQINKITQVVTQRVIKRQYIDPNTGQIIEYDPNNELFANLPPETVFEEHTIISDDNGTSAPVVTTTTVSKTNPGQTVPPKKYPVNIAQKMGGLSLEGEDYVDNMNGYVCGDFSFVVVAFFGRLQSRLWQS